MGIDEHRFPSVRFFRNQESSSWIKHKPWTTTIVDLDTGPVLGVVDGRDHKGVGDWLFARRLQWHLGVQIVAIDPSAAFRKALRMWLPPTAFARNALGQAAHRLEEVFAAGDATGKLQAVWKVKEQLRLLLRTNSLADAADAKEELKALVEAAGLPETNKLYRTVCRSWNEMEVLIVTGATTAKVEANNTGIKHIKRTARGYRNTGNYKWIILTTSAVRTAA